MSNPMTTTTIAPNGHKVVLEVFDNNATVLTHFDENGNVLARQCSGRCGSTQVGPINCPEGTSPSLNCTSNPPTIRCVKD